MSIRSGGASRTNKLAREIEQAISFALVSMQVKVRCPFIKF
jgi:hypothetical protein